MHHTWLDNLRLIADYVFFDDAPALLGVPKKTLTAWARGKREPGPADKKNIARIAGKFRRREAQLKRQQQEEDTRAARRSARASLRLIGKESLPLPDRLPPFLRSFEAGKLASPVFIYDFRDLGPNDVLQFFRFMKHVVPNGSFFFTYKLTTAGVSSEKEGMFFSNRAIGNLMKLHSTTSPTKAIRVEIGTAAADVTIERQVDGYQVYGVRYISTRYISFCDPDSASGTCEIMLDAEFLDLWNYYNDRSARREVIEVGISYPRPLERTEDEIEEDRIRGADPVTGLVYVYQD